MNGCLLLRDLLTCGRYVIKRTEHIPRRNDVRFFYGTPLGTRTLDTLIKSQVLYQLS